MYDYNCYVCLDCGKRFDRPFTSRIIGGAILSEYCPKCHSENIKHEYDEDYEDFKREMWAEMLAD